MTRTLFILTSALCLALLHALPMAAVAMADETPAVHASATPSDASDILFRVRGNIPMVSAEIVNNAHGTNTVLGGSVGIDIVEFVVLEVGGGWLDVDAGGWDVFGRAGVAFVVMDSRKELPSRPAEGWQQAVPVLAGYRFLHDAAEVDDVSAATDVHLITIGAGWQATWFWASGIGIEFRFLPSLGFAVAEDAEAGWGQPGPATPGSFLPPAVIGNSDDMVWGLDLELTVGVVF